MISGNSLNDFSVRITARTAYTVFSILKSDPNTTEEQLLALLEVVFGSGLRPSWHDAKLKHLAAAAQLDGAVC